MDLETADGNNQFLSGSDKEEKNQTIIILIIITI